MNFEKQFNLPASISKTTLDREMLKFTLALYNNPLLSRKAVEDVIILFDNFISELFLPCIQAQMEKVLKPITDNHSYHKAQFILENNKYMFNKFSTEHLRFKLYEQESLYVPPQTFEIGEEPIYETINEEKVQVGKKTVYGTHIPLPETLKTILETPGVFKQMKKYVRELSKDTALLSNFVQGELWSRKYTTRNINKIVFPLFLYSGEFEQKLGGLFVSLTCLPPHLVTKLENIFISTIFYSKHLETYGKEKLFCKTIDDLNILSKEGLMINVEGCDVRIYFECVLVSGDYLGLNCICGFSESFASTRYCRICCATSLQCKEMVVEDPALIRTVESYEHDLLKDDFLNTGIKERCVFNKIYNFHIAENMCIDVMHDFSEGVVAYTIAKVLQALIHEKVLLLDLINNRIDSFPYNNVEMPNKPRPLHFTTGKKGDQKLKIKQTTSEMLCLSRYLGLMIGDLVPAKNKYWKLYRCLRKIIGIITSPKLNRGEIENLRELLQKHNFLYLSLFGKLKPNMHIWLHYVQIMLLNGPLLHYSTMIFKKKSKKLKEIALASTCTANLPYTVAIRNQLQLCYTRESCNPILNDILLGPVNSTDAHDVLKRLCPDLRENTPVSTFKYVEFIEKQFFVGTVLITEITDDGPLFGMIKEIFFCNDNVYFYVSQFDTIYFDHYHHAYSINSKSDEPDKLINLELIPRLPPCLHVTTNIGEFIATMYDI